MKRLLILALVATACTSQSDTTTTTIDTAAEATTVVSTTTPPDGGSTTTDPDQGQTTTTTTTTTTRATTTSGAPATTTTVPATTIIDNNTAPTVTITGPANLTLHRADFDAALNWFVADVALTADIGDPDGDAVTVEWFSDVAGSLGSGAAITAALQPVTDSTVHMISAVATDANGAMTSATITIVVWIPSS